MLQKHKGGVGTWWAAGREQSQNLGQWVERIGLLSLMLGKRQNQKADA